MSEAEQCWMALKITLTYRERVQIHPNPACQELSSSGPLWPPFPFTTNLWHIPQAPSHRSVKRVSFRCTKKTEHVIDEGPRLASPFEMCRSSHPSFPLKLIIFRNTSSSYAVDSFPFSLLWNLLKIISSPVPRIFILPLPTSSQTENTEPSLIRAPCSTSPSLLLPFSSATRFLGEGREEPMVFTTSFPTSFTCWPTELWIPPYSFLLTVWKHGGSDKIREGPWIQSRTLVIETIQ